MGEFSEPDLRIGDVERNDAMVALGAHLTSGRLDLAEYDERCALAMAARTRHQLEDLFADLPAPHPDLSSAVRPDPRPRKPARTKGGKIVDTPLSRALDTLGGSVILAGIPGAGVLTVTYGLWWTFFVVAGVIWLTTKLSDLVKHRSED